MAIQKRYKSSTTFVILSALSLLSISCDDAEEALVAETEQDITTSTAETNKISELPGSTLGYTDEETTDLDNTKPKDQNKPGNDASTTSIINKSDTPASTPPSDTQPLTQAQNSASLQWGTDASKPSNGWSKPSIGAVYKDPSYGTSVQRVSDAGSDRFNRNTYSRRQAENADGTMFLTYHGNASYHVYAVATNTLINELSVHPDGEPQWHPTNPSVLRHTSGGNSYVGSLKLHETNVKTDTTETIADLTSRIQAKIPSALYMQDRAEGSPSSDGNRYAWMVYNSAEKPVGFVSYDLKQDAILGITSSIDPSRFDWVSMSPSGKYVVASETNGTYVFNADFSNKRLLTEAIEHSDIGYDKDGRETYVYIDFNSKSATAGWLTAVDLATGERTKIFDIYDNANSSVHISMKGYDKPGWALISTYNCKVPGAWTCDKIFAVEIAPNGRILNLAHTYNCGNNYWTETHAVVNRSFTRVYYNSDAGSCGIDAEVYRLDVPSFE